MDRNGIRLAVTRFFIVSYILANIPFIAMFIILLTGPTHISFDFKNPVEILLIVCLFLIPAVFAGLGIVILFKRSWAVIYLGFASVYWLVASFGEILEEDPLLQPNPIYVVLMAVISSLCIVFLMAEWRLGRFRSHE